MKNSGLKRSLKQQLQNNLIAIVSIFIAISSLAYNTWRNEQTEYNRNVRTSSFQILMSLAELQLLVDHAFYNEDKDKGDPIKGWSYVLYVQDLAQTVSPQVQQNAAQLKQVWAKSWQLMDEQQSENDAITQSIKALRLEVLATLQALH
ncbi:hypothetical protein [Thalassotalea sp. ND16A]|uniref:hypothetical protein n=1 Tax=Thalassotalea sp. ND16A TaxID=1535422 RepID=UPI00051A8749|nr:hypothetical protein [Thalassotalea sp. ND16A]KGJ99140.1 hypothetical protein ND16A_3904 [Thalassotalea sp. ND16A]